jgi:integrase
MPAKIIFKETTLNGRAEIVQYQDRENLTLRIPKGNKKYWNKSLSTSDVAMAHQRAVDVYFATIQQPVDGKNRKYLFATLCDKFLEDKQEQADIGNIRQSTVDTYEQRIRQRIIPYARLVGIRNVGDINEESFEKYAVHYRKVQTKGKWKNAADGLAVSTINSDLATLGELQDWLVRKKYLEVHKKSNIQKLTDKTNYREEANPAYLPDEWEQVKHTLFKHAKSETDSVKRWKKEWLNLWVMIMYHGGFRCHELRRVRVGDCRSEKKAGNLFAYVDIRPNTKTGKRTVAMNGHWLWMFKHHLNLGLKLRNEQIQEHNQMVEEGTLPRWRKNQEPMDLLPERAPSDWLLMTNPFSKNLTPYSEEDIRQKLAALLADLEFYSKNNYTLHSIRSTYITHSIILQKLSTRDIADNVGNSEAEIERTYYRLKNELNENLGFFRKKLEKTAVNGKDELIAAVTEEQARRAMQKRMMEN